MAADPPTQPAPVTGAAPTPDPFAQLAELGPFFEVQLHRPGSPLRLPWHPLAELTASPDALAARIAGVRGRLAESAGCAADDVEFRVAASVTQLGLCARLLSPVLGAAASGWALAVDTAQARWIPALGGPFRLSLPEPVTAQTASPGEGSVTATPGITACLDLLAGPVAQIVRAVEAMAVSPRVLWGNVASAVNGAAAVIARGRPELAAPAVGTAAAMLRYPPLAGTYQGSPGASFRRRNCCLIYRLAPPGTARYCGDCVLDPV